jgi:hypothetical protein
MAPKKEDEARCLKMKGIGHYSIRLTGVLVIMLLLALASCTSSTTVTTTATATMTQTATATATKTVTPTPTVTPTAVPGSVPPEATQYAKDWPQPGRDYSNSRATMDTKINSSNVGTLGVAWVTTSTFRISATMSLSLTWRLASRSGKRSTTFPISVPTGLRSGTERSLPAPGPTM